MVHKELIRVKGLWYLKVTRTDGDFGETPPVAQKNFSKVEVRLDGKRAKRKVKVTYPKGTKVNNLEIPLKVISELERYHDAWEMINQKR